MAEDDRAIWLFWEGPCPPYVALCLETILRRHPEARLLDRAGFDRLHRHDRDLALDALSLNHLSDYVRAYLLAHHGGLYVDADCIALDAFDPLFDLAATHGLVGYREPQGCMSCNFIAARRGSAVARTYYANVVGRIRRGPPFAWLDLASVPMDAAMAAAGAGAAILPTASVMPIPWHAMHRLLPCRDDAEHAAHLPREAWTVMLSNAAIGWEEATAAIPGLSRAELLGGRSFLSFLLRRALGLPDRPPLTGTGARPTVAIGPARA